MRQTAIERYLSWQTALARYGVTRHAESLFFELCREIEADPFLDREGFQSVLERLHCAAYPNPATRPPRLNAGELETILE
jgi:hypothetical protein